MYKEITANKRKTFLLFAIFIVLILAVGWAFWVYYDRLWILVLAVIIAVIQPIIAYYWSDKITLAISGAKGPIKRSDDSELWNAAENLCITTGLPMPKIYIIESAAANAFATGRDPEHASIAVTAGLREKLSRVELEGVLSHELSHIGNRDILVMTVVVVLVGLLSIAADFFLRSMWFGSREERRGGGNVLAIIGLILIILSPIIATLIQLAISRRREFLADATGALTTRYPEGLARALEKISKDRVPLQIASNATAHLYIVNPFQTSAKFGSWLSGLFSTHPPVAERIKRLRQMISK